MLKKIRNVKPDQVRDVLKRVVLLAFQPGTANLIVTCSKIMEENLVKKFAEVGFKPDVQPLEYFQDDYGLKPKDGEDEPDEEDEEDDEDEVENDDEGMETPGTEDDA